MKISSARAGGRLNIVMMGQGEPLLNLPNVVKATRILLDPAGFALSPRRITVSTAGIVPRSRNWAASRCGPSWPSPSTPPAKSSGRN